MRPQQADRLPRLPRGRVATWVGRKWNELAKGVEPAYSDLDPAKLSLYQYYIERCLEAVDVENYTKQTMAKPYDKARMENDDVELEGIIRAEAGQKDGLAPAVLQVMLCQYFAADILQREFDRDRWVERVMHPKRDANYFPSPSAVLRTFFEGK